MDGSSYERGYRAGYKAGVKSLADTEQYKKGYNDAVHEMMDILNDMKVER